METGEIVGAAGCLRRPWCRCGRARREAEVIIGSVRRTRCNRDLRWRETHRSHCHDEADERDDRDDDEPDQSDAILMTATAPVTRAQGRLAPPLLTIRLDVLFGPEQCESAFFAAEWQLLRGNKAEARASLQIAVDSCPKNFVEYPGAISELRRLGQ